MCKENTGNDRCVTLLGVRGSVAVSGKDYSKYGGATTCIAVRLAGQLLVIDAGNGILNLSRVLRQGETTIPLLLSHPHTDHLSGLLNCSAFYDRNVRVDCYSAQHGGISAEKQIKTLFAPPLWPIGPEMMPAEFRYYPLGERNSVGPLTVRVMEGCHPGGVSLFRIEGEGKSIVVATDCTLKEENFPAITEFAENCDLLLCDGQYSDAEWECKKNYGHSTWNNAARFGVLCGAKQMRIIHHDPYRTDRELDLAGEETKKIHPKCSIAYENEVIVL